MRFSLVFFILVVLASCLAQQQPPALRAQDWEIVSVVEDPLAPGRYTGIIQFSASGPARQAVAAYWSNWRTVQENANPTVDLGLDSSGRRRFRMSTFASAGTRWNAKLPGETLSNIAVRYRLPNNPTISPNSLDRKSFTAPLPLTTRPSTPPPTVPTTRAPTTRPSTPPPTVPTTRAPTSAYTVANSAQLLSAMRSAQPGQAISCLGGDYDGFASSTAIAKASPGVTVRAASRSSPPIFRGTVALTNLQGITFDGLVFDGNARDDFGFPSGYGLRLPNSVRVTIRNCIFRNLHAGINLTPGSRNAIIEWNLFERIGMDGIRAFSNHYDLIVRNNRFQNPWIDIRRSGQTKGEFYIRNLAGQQVLINKDVTDSRHPDFLQFNERSENVLIENNYVRTFNGYCQSFFLRAESSDELGPAGCHVNFTVRGNYIESAHGHGIGLGGIRGVLVEGNLMRIFPVPAGEQLFAKPRISVINSFNTGIIRNNVQPASYLLLNNANMNGITINTNNVISETATPSGWSMPSTGPYGYDTVTRAESSDDSSVNNNGSNNNFLKYGLPALIAAVVVVAVIVALIIVALVYKKRRAASRLSAELREPLAPL